MNARQTWHELQSHLSAARAFLEASDYNRALAETDAALVIDSQFLAAQSLRERILAAAPRAGTPAYQSAPAARPAASVQPAPSVLLAPSVEPAPSVPPAPSIQPTVSMPPAASVQPATSVQSASSIPASAPTLASAPASARAIPLADLPLRSEASPRSSPPDIGYAKFEQRAKRRRVDRRLDAARVAIVQRRFHDAVGALDEVRHLDPNAPELSELIAAAEKIRGGSVEPRRGAWLAAALVFGGTIFAASWLEENQRALLSHPTLSMSGLVDTSQQNALPDASPNASPDTTRTGDVDREPAPDAATAATSGLATSPLPAAMPSTSAPPPSPPPIAAASAPTPIAIAPAAAPTTAAPTYRAPSEPPIAPPQIPVAPAQLHAALPAATTPASDAPLNAAASSPAMAAAASTPPVETTPSAAVPPRPDVDEIALVRQALQRYRIAYDGLDAGSAQAVWPAVNEGALAKAFDGLESQTLTFDDCRVQLQNETATATCRGRTRYVPKVGSREPRTEPRVWNFLLHKSGGEWTIANARVGR